MASQYNLSRRIANIAKAVEMLDTQTWRENRKTGKPELLRYDPNHIKYITGISRALLNDLIKGQR